MSFRSPGETVKAGKTLMLQAMEKLKKKLPRSRAVLAIPALIVVGFLVTASFQPNACAVMIEGKEVAVVKDKAFAEGVLKDACAKISSEQEVFLEDEVTFKDVRLQGRDLATEDELSKIFLSQVGFSTAAVAITIDGKTVAWVQDEAAAKQVMDKFKAGFFRKDAETLSLEMKNDLAYKKGKVAVDKVMDCDAVVNLLKTGSAKVVTCTVKKGDTLWTIARKNDTHVADILKANPGLTENSVLALGSQIKLTKAEPLVHVEAVYKKSVQSVMAFKTEYVKDPKLASGRSKVKQKGQSGKKEVVYRFRTRDGVKVGQEKLGAEVIEKPVTKVVAMGSRLYLASRGGKSRGGSVRGSGSLRWPTSARRISQGYHSGHGAIDIDGNTGDPVYASDGGKVTFAGWSGDYGKCIIINHGNGIRTRYAHCSSLSVSAGDSVSKGEVIGRVGSTGRSTGSHLHFEVIVGGCTRNPLNYVR